MIQASQVQGCIQTDQKAKSSPSVGNAVKGRGTGQIRPGSRGSASSPPCVERQSVISTPWGLPLPSVLRHRARERLKTRIEEDSKMAQR